MNLKTAQLMGLTGLVALCALASIAFMLAAASASAQYVWIDAKGSRNYSDRPPPPGTPSSKILKAPRGMEQIMAAAAGPATPSPEQEAAAKSLAVREENYQKRRQESAESAKKSQDEAERAAIKKENCDAARAAQAQLESGIRVRSRNSADPYAVMDDKERTSEIARANKALANCR